MKLKQAKVPMYTYTSTNFHDNKGPESEKDVTQDYRRSDIIQKLNDFAAANAENPHIDKTYQTGDPKETTRNIQTSYKRNVALSHWDEIQEKYGNKIQELIKQKEKSSEEEISQEKMALSLGWYAYRAEQLGIGQKAINYMLDSITKDTLPSNPDPYTNANTAYSCIETFQTVPNYERGKEIFENVNRQTLLTVLEYIQYNDYNPKAIQAIGKCEDSTAARSIEKMLEPTEIDGRTPNKKHIKPSQAMAITEACNKLYNYVQKTGYHDAYLFATADIIGRLVRDNTLSTNKNDENYTTKFVDKYIEAMQDYPLERIYNDLDYHKHHIEIDEFAEIYKEQQKAKQAKMQQQQKEEKKPKKDKDKDKDKDKKKDKKEKKKDKKKSKKSKSARLQELDTKFGHIEMQDANDEYTP